MKYFNPNVIKFLKTLSKKDRYKFLNFFKNKDILTYSGIQTNSITIVLCKATVHKGLSYIYKKALKYENSM